SLLQLEFSPIGEVLLLADQERAEVWEFNSLGPSGHHEERSGVIDASFSDDGALVYAKGKQVRLWRIRRDDQLLAEVARAVAAVGASPNASVIAVSTEDGAIHIFNSQTRQQGILGRHDGPARLLFASKHRLLASAGFSDGQVRVWDLDTNRLKYGFKHHN